VQKWHVFKRTSARQLKIELGPNSVAGATLQSVTAFLTGHETLPELGAELDYSSWSAKADKRDAVVTRWRAS
jgi:hypothetical protein